MLYYIIRYNMYVNNNYRTFFVMFLISGHLISLDDVVQCPIRLAGWLGKQSLVIKLDSLLSVCWLSGYQARWLVISALVQRLSAGVG